MLRYTTPLQASKATSSYCKNKYFTSKRPMRQFRFDVGETIETKSVITTQKHRYDHQYFVRPAEFQNGKNVDMHQKTYTLQAQKSGVLGIRRSVVNPKHRWVTVEDDIGRHHNTMRMRRHFAATGEYNYLNDDNPHYQHELHVLKKGAGWYDEIRRELPLTERYSDPNVLSRAPNKVDSIVKPRFTYE